MNGTERPVVTEGYLETHEHRATAVAAYLLGGLLALPLLSLVGVLLLGHASFDRVLGLGFQDASSPGLEPLKPSCQRA